MTSRAHAEFDPNSLGIRIAVQRGEARLRQVLTWQPPGVAVVEEGGRQPAEDTWLHLQEDDARAIYEALADHFGHAGHDIRALRRDYEAERERVDRLIGYAITPPIIVNGDVTRAR